MQAALLSGHVHSEIGNAHIFTHWNGYVSISVNAVCGTVIEWERNGTVKLFQVET